METKTYESQRETSVPTQQPKWKRLVRPQKGFAKLLSVSGIALTVLLPVGVIPRVINSHELDETQKHLSKELPVVSTKAPTQAENTRKINLPGSIEAINETSVYARTNGYVSQRYVDIGDRVTAGQLLAHLDTPEIDHSAVEAESQMLTTIASRAQSQANLEKAKADVETAQANLTQSKANLEQRESDLKFSWSTYLRWKKLGEQGAISMQDVDEKETRHKENQAMKDAAIARVRATESELNAAKARLKAEEANVSAASANVAASRAHAQRSSTEQNFQNVVSPFAGVITERNVDNGMLVSSGSDSSKTPLYKVARIDALKVFVDVPQYAAPGIHVGSQVTISLREFPNEQFTGTIARTSVALDPTSRTLRTEVHIPNKQLRLAPGMYADVALQVPRVAPTVLIPSSSLISRGDGPQAIVVDRDKKVHYRKLQLGEDLGTELEVLGGLSQADSVVLNPPDSLTENSLVAIKSPN